MNKQTHTKRPWHPIEASILTHVARYGVTTAAASCALGLKGMKHPEQARERLSALARKCDLIHHKAPFEDCYSLSTAAAARTTELGVNFPAGIHSSDSLTRAYALLSVCCLQKEKRKLLTSTELTKHFPDLRPHGQASNYYLSRELGQIRLGFVRLDRGGRGRWDRIARKACDDMRKHLGIRSLQPMLDKQQFEICVVTALPCKARRIDEVLNTNQHLLHVPYRIISIPTLINFIRPRPD